LSEASKLVFQIFGTNDAQAWILGALFYLILSFGGVLLFPPMAICLYLTDGDLEYCSLGVFNNDYKKKKLFDTYTS
jgi:hypothetical protein